jgi:hypothetical protein
VSGEFGIGKPKTTTPDSSHEVSRNLSRDLPGRVENGGSRASSANENGVHHVTFEELPGYGFAGAPAVQNLNNSESWHRDKSSVVTQRLDGFSVVRMDHDTQLSTSLTQPLNDGQGLDIHMQICSNAPGAVSAELIEPKEPYAQTINETVPVSAVPGGGRWQDVTFHGIVPASPQGMSFNLKVPAGEGSVDFRNIQVRPADTYSAGLPHSTVAYGGVSANPSSAVDSIQQRQGQIPIEVRNGQPFVIGFEVQSLHPEDRSPAQLAEQKFLQANADIATVTPYWNQTQNLAKEQEFEQQY